jgi:hypothetical protein
MTTSKARRFSTTSVDATPPVRGVGQGLGRADADRPGAPGLLSASRSVLKLLVPLKPGVGYILGEQRHRLDPAVGKHPLQIVVAERQPEVPPDRPQDVLGRGAPDTILSGVVGLVHVGMRPAAFLAFFASITVPALNLVGLVHLLVSVRRRKGRPSLVRHAAG